MTDAALPPARPRPLGEAVARPRLVPVRTQMPG
jgi:hypothetical protein